MFLTEREREREEPRLDIEVEYGEHVALIWFCKHYKNLLVPLHYHDHEGLYVATHLPLGISSYFTHAEMCSGRYLKSIWNILPNNKKMACMVHPPESFIALDIKTDSISFFNDYLGEAQFFEQKFPEMRVWTNFPPLLPFITRVPLEMDYQAWSAYACTRVFMRGVSPYKDVKELRHGLFVYAEQGQDCKIVPYISDIFDLEENKIPKKEDYKNISDTIFSFISDVDRCVEGDFQCDLSGGKDSRIICAHIIAQKIRCKFNTISPPNLEFLIAKRLLECVGYEKNHETKRFYGNENEDLVPLYPCTDDIIDWYKREFYVYRCGRGELLSQQPPVSYIECEYLPKRLGGQFGEPTYVNHYSKELAQSYSYENIFSRYLTNFIIKNEYTLLDAKEACISLISEKLDNLKNFKMTFPYIQDYFLSFYIAEKIFSSSSIVEPISYCTLYDYLHTGYAMPVLQKFDMEFHRTLTGNIIPEWKDIPYYEQMIQKNDNRALAFSFFWNNEKLYAGIKDILSSEMISDGIYNYKKLNDFYPQEVPRDAKHIFLLTRYNEIVLSSCKYAAHKIFLQEINDKALT